MIYTYKYINHPIEDFHKHIMYFFEKLFALNPPNFDDSLFNDEFKDCIITSEALKDGFKKLYELYNNLRPNEQQLLKDAFVNNTNIKKICENIEIHPKKYSDLLFLTKEIDGRDVCFFKDFLKKLWVQYPHVTNIKNRYRLVQDHFNRFRDENEKKGLVCPFCGLHNLKPSSGDPNVKSRDGYDHIAAEAFYPFVSVNLENLAPICVECNSDEKKTKDPFYNVAGKRRRVLYPYDTNYKEDNLEITIEQNNLVNTNNLGTLLRSIDWDIAIKHEGVEKDFLLTWDDVFEIKKRYSKYLKQHEEGWYSYLIKKYNREKQKGTSYEDYKDEILNESKEDIKITPLGILKYVYCNFLLSKNSFRSYLENL